MTTFAPNRPRLLITGASGYLGHRLLPMARERAEVIAISRYQRADEMLRQHKDVRWLQADLTDDLHSLFAEHQPRAIIHAAAINPGVDDDHLDRNGIMSLKVAEAAAAIGARLVVVSSDMVHAGSDTPYGDEDSPAPINDYGRSKADAELAALSTHDDAICVRTSLIYGLEKIDRGTASFMARIARGETQTLFDNVLRQPVWVDALSQGLIRLALDMETTGTLNLAGDELISRADFARRMLRYWNQSTANINVGPAPEGRGIPLKIALRHDRAQDLGMPTPGVSDVLDRCQASVSATDDGSAAIC